MEHNLARVFDAVAGAVGEREAIVTPHRRLDYEELRGRSDRLANLLLDRGLGVHRERRDLAGWESGQDHLGLYLHDGAAYLEAMLGAYAARVAPFNVNHRYVEDELVYLLRDANAAGLVFHAAFAPTVQRVLARVPSLRLLLQVEDGSGEALLPGATPHEEALAASSPRRPPTEPSPDDLYILYTGGTTGMPKGVLWRQADIYPAAMGGRDAATHREWESLEEIVAVAREGGARLMPTSPLMHGAAQWMAHNALLGGSTLVLADAKLGFDPAAVCRMIDREQVTVVLIVGDAFARPLVDELATGRHGASSVLLVANGGATLSAPLKQRLLELLPNASLLDAVGASETGQQARQVLGLESPISTGTFAPSPGACLVDETRTRVLDPSERSLGWLAQHGRIPLGYLGDEERTRRTFPVIDGRRHAIPGDRARYTADGSIELHGRDAATINSGGEKIFAEEVEQALRRHTEVYDVVVTGGPSERWGEEVVAVVALREGAAAEARDLVATCAPHLARYKLPKRFVFVEEVQRSPAGKADYRWARALAERAAGSSRGDGSR